MKHLVISVSPDSSLSLLTKYTDIILLDEQPIAEVTLSYDSIYIRSHFSKAETMPQIFRNEIKNLVKQARRLNPNITFIDQMDIVDEIVDFEDKWHQYQLFSDLMPNTELLEGANVSSFKRPIYKNRLSSRGSGVSWKEPDAAKTKSDWIVQESIDIQEELRVYVIKGIVYPVGVVRNSMTKSQKAQVVKSRKLDDDEIRYFLTVAKLAPKMDFIGLDIAKNYDGHIYLMEVNRSPGFKAFEEVTHVNLASILYEG